jgi:hypothetical protein
MRSSDVEVMRAAGLSEDVIAKALALSPIKTREPRVRIDVCPACGQKSMRGDFVCGACSALKAKSDRRFWQLVDNRTRGFDGRPIYEKPGPQQLPAQTPKPVAHKIVALRETTPTVEREPERREFLVTVGKLGRVVVATSAPRAAAVAHAINEDPETAGHAILDLGVTVEPETEIPAKVGKMGAPVAVERRFRVAGPGMEIEVATNAVTQKRG